ELALLSIPPLPPDALLFVNLSPLTLDLDANAPSWLAPMVGRAGLSPDNVVVEVTERFGGRTEAVVRRLTRLRKQGFKIAIDDVGTGNSGLEVLRRIDAEFIKLDAGVVSAAKSESGARAILMAMALFARQTGARVIAEGIENADDLRFIKDLNDNHEVWLDNVVQGGQGYGLGRPSPERPTHPALLHATEHRPPESTTARPTSNAS